MTTDILHNDAISKPSAKHWKQWLLLYPSFAIAVLGAVPQYIDVVKGLVMEVDAGAVADAEEQQRLFIRNIDCQLSLEAVTTQTNTNVAVGACPTGDIQVDIQYPGGERVVRWFAFEKFTPQHASLWPSFIKTAMASEPTPKPATEPVTSRVMLAQQDIQVICQKKLTKEKYCAG